MPIRIEPLSAERLEEACTLVDRVFASEPVKADLSLRESLDKGRHRRQRLQEEYGEDIDRIDDWVAIDTETDRVVGTCGIYDVEEDENEAAWVDWFCVDPEYRGHGAGHLLLDTVIAEATARGKKFLRLYSLEFPEPTVAHRMYFHRGFEVTRKVWDPTRNGTLMYLEKKL